MALMDRDADEDLGQRRQRNPDIKLCPFEHLAPPPAIRGCSTSANLIRVSMAHAVISLHTTAHAEKPRRSEICERSANPVIPYGEDIPAVAANAGGRRCRTSNSLVSNWPSVGCSPGRRWSRPASSCHRWRLRQWRQRPGWSRTGGYGRPRGARPAGPARAVRTRTARSGASLAGGLPLDRPDRSGDRGKHDRGIRDRSCHGSGRVLTVGDRHDAGSADARDPAVVCIWSAVAMLSLIRMGMRLQVGDRGLLQVESRRLCERDGDRHPQNQQTGQSRHRRSIRAPRGCLDVTGAWRPAGDPGRAVR